MQLTDRISPQLNRLTRQQKSVTELKYIGGRYSVVAVAMSVLSLLMGVLFDSSGGVLACGCLSKPLDR